MIKTFTLSNGIHVVTYQIPQVKSVHLSIAVKGGSLSESTEKNGVAHFMEHMLVQGIPSFPTVEELSTHIESLAGSYNAYTSQLTVAFLITLPFIHLEEAVKIASEVMLAPLFPENVIEKERQAVISEITQRKDSLGYKLGKQFKTTRFVRGSLLHRDVGGSLDTVKKITREDMLEYWQKYFLPKNSYIYVGGNFEESRLKKLLENYFGAYNSDKSFLGFPSLATKDFAERQIILKENKELGTNYITLSFPTFGMEKDWKLTACQDIALTILGQLRTSRLFKLLRYQKGLVYGISAHRALLPEIGYIDVDCETATEHVEEVIELITKTMSEFISNGPTDKELAFIKDYFINTWLMAFDNPGSAAEWLEEELLWEEKVRTPEEYIEMVKEITKEQIIDVIKNNWDLKKLQLLIQGPYVDSKENKTKMQQILKNI